MLWEIAIRPPQTIRVPHSLSPSSQCVANMVDLVDPVTGSGGLLDFQNFLTINIYICNSTARACDFGQPSYINSVEATCTNGKIVTRDVKVCQTDLDRNATTPARFDLDFINIPFCMATSCPDDVEIVELHKLLYAEGGSTGGDNPYDFFVDTLLGNCSGCTTGKQGRLGLLLLFVLGVFNSVV
eukprot:scaffold7491_cov69-Cylindrotheca_fusiformis.AAC.1